MPCNESARYSETWASIAGMHLPSDWTAVDSNSRVPLIQSRFASLAASLNFIGDMFMQTGREWLFLMNDDHVYPPNTILKLLAHDKDFVTGVYTKKQVPFEPILYDRINDDGTLRSKKFRKGEGGLVPIVGCGDGVLLIRRTVLEKIPQPWWEMSSPDSPDLITQDLIFCKKVREAGFEMWADLDTSVGHIALMPIWAERNPDGDWKTVIMSGPSGALTLDAAQET